MSDFDNNPYAVNNVTDDYRFQQQAPVHVPDYLVLSILMPLFCCQPLGIAAIVFSALAKGEIGSGNYQKAMNHAKNAKICLLIGVIGGVLLILFFLGLGILGALSEQQMQVQMH